MKKMLVNLAIGIVQRFDADPLPLLRFFRISHETNNGAWRTQTLYGIVEVCPMKYRDLNDKTPFVPVPTGQVVNVTADDTELLRMMFGEQAPEVAESLRKPRKVNQYVQVMPPNKD